MQLPDRSRGVPDPLYATSEPDEEILARTHTSTSMFVLSVLLVGTGVRHDRRQTKASVLVCPGPEMLDVGG
jgi:hypothetical protein